MNTLTRQDYQEPGTHHVQKYGGYSLDGRWHTSHEGTELANGEEPDEEMLAKCQDIARAEFANQATLEDENSY